ncbi:Crp/Fnr family transcriptional regulator [Dyadobacter sp. CY345]|uniref:Crp/Fnr family transcriptional regulator n=1 Tax=Dyadobacter sp. CY345 TaxID=2909335 RepID=UPI001F3B6FE9|nr:Crp/Fnr family transcriptional regulator [Dyadobacter sp. CY345]MCF2445837.1 Crp/Fnr family transcriptional regulator [Dyadobacter sp. CY345]
MLKLFNYDLQSFASPSASKALLSKITVKKLAESETILSPGQYQHHLYFVKEGVVRCYYQSLEMQWTNWFAAEGSPIFSTESFLIGNPSPEYIETCTPVILYQITREDYQTLMEEFPELYQPAFHLLQSYLHISEKRLYGSHMQTAYKRYEDFIETHRHIANRVKMNHIASYLGITPTHLSRIRREFARKDYNNLVKN